jgi:hypothetical protein
VLGFPSVATYLGLRCGLPSIFLWSKLYVTQDIHNRSAAEDLSRRVFLGVGAGLSVRNIVDEKINILMVDDQPGKLLSYEAMLGELGENLIKVHSGAGGLLLLGSVQASVSVRLRARLAGRKFTFLSRFSAAGGTTNHEDIFLLGAHIALNNS